MPSITILKRRLSKDAETICWIVSNFVGISGFNARALRRSEIVHSDAAVGRTPTRAREIGRLPSTFILRHSALMSDYRFFDRLRADAAAERRAIIAGLLSRSAAIAPKHFMPAPILYERIAIELILPSRDRGAAAIPAASALTIDVESPIGHDDRIFEHAWFDLAPRDCFRWRGS